MARQTFDYSHGDVGTKPDNPLNFKKDGRPQSEYFDWYWKNVTDYINGHADEFDRLDSNNDGVVDAADGAATWSRGGSTQATHPTDINFTGDIDLTDDGDGTVTVNVDRYTDLEALRAVENSPTLTVANADTVDGEDASAFADAGHLHDGRYVQSDGDSMQGPLTLSDGSVAASRSWVNANGDVPNADYADNAGSADTAGDADTVDGQHASEFANMDGDIYITQAGASDPTVNDGDLWFQYE